MIKIRTANFTDTMILETKNKKKQKKKDNKQTHKKQRMEENTLRFLPQEDVKTEPTVSPPHHSSNHKIPLLGVARFIKIAKNKLAAIKLSVPPSPLSPPTPVL